MSHPGKYRAKVNNLELVKGFSVNSFTALKGLRLRECSSLTQNHMSHRMFISNIKLAQCVLHEKFPHKTAFPCSILFEQFSRLFPQIKQLTFYCDKIHTFNVNLVLRNKESCVDVRNTLHWRNQGALQARHPRKPILSF